MAEPKIKGRLESQELTTNQPEPVRQRLRACLASDADNIRPKSTGDHVKAIQDALREISKRRPQLGLPAITDAPGEYGPTTAAAVKKYKKENAIVRPGQELDDIVGRMTITRIDDDLISGPAPAPKPVPPLPPPPIVGVGGVQIGPLGVGSRGLFVSAYYTNCGLETIGPGQIATVGIRTYSTLEGLIDLLITRSEPHQVIVNHGDPDKGLIIPYTKETGARNTAEAIDDLSALADRAEKGPIDPTNSITKFFLDKAAQKIRVNRTVVLRIVAKLVTLRKKKFIIHLRACNMDDANLVDFYRTAFGARMITFHPSRLFFLRFILDQMNPGFTVATTPNLSNAIARLRKFEDPIGLLSPMMLAINDIDGHTHVEQESFIERRDSSQVLGWAQFLLRQWREAAPGGFVVPIMWQDNKDISAVNGVKTFTFHCPLEVGWRKLLKFVPPIVTV